MFQYRTETLIIAYCSKREHTSAQKTLAMFQELVFYHMTAVDDKLAKGALAQIWLANTEVRV